MKQIIKIAVVGSRSFEDYTLFEKVMKTYLSEFDNVAFVSGGAKGADALAQRYAEENGVEMIVFKPEWSRYGRGAGYVRNKQIWQEADRGIAFWDGKSKGTQHSFKLAHELEKPLQVYDYVKKAFVSV